MPLNPLPKRATRLFIRLKASRRGNVAIIVSLSMIPMSLAVGMGVDYTLQKQRQDQLAGIADAAALVAVTPTMMATDVATAQTAAQNFWNSQSATVANANATGTVTVPPDITSGTTVSRTVSVAWSGASNNTFASLLGMPTSPLVGTSSAKSQTAPVINFYLMVDTSPSMGIAATTQGIKAMVAATPQQGGCAFACHETNPTSGDTAGNPGGEDNYALSQSIQLPGQPNVGVPLRIDLVNDAVLSLMNTAVSTAATYKTTYGISVSTIDYQVGQLYQTSNITRNLNTAKTQIGSIKQLTVARNNCININNCNGPGGGDMDSYLDLGLRTLDASVGQSTSNYNASAGPGYALYRPGNGGSPNVPQEVLFIITDGAVDQQAPGGGRVYGPINTLFEDNCTKIKASGVRIAFLYLTYNPLTTNSWYNTYIAPFQSQIGTAASSCASPGLYQNVNTDGDVTAALTTLFQAAVSTAHLTH